MRAIFLFVLTAAIAAAQLIDPSNGGGGGGAGGLGAANVQANIAGPATTSGAIDVTSLALTSTTMNSVIVQCSTGTGFSGGLVTGPLTALACNITARSTTSFTVGFSSSSNVLVVLNSSGGAGPAGPAGANGVDGAPGAEGPAGGANQSFACTSAGNNTITHNKTTTSVLVEAYTGTSPNEVPVNPKIGFRPTSTSAGVIVFETADANRRCVVNASNGPAGGGGGDELQANKNQANGYMGLDGSARAAKVNQHGQTVYADQTITWSGRTGFLDIALGALRFPSGTALPGTCVNGEAFIDTDATSGQRFYACEGTNNWVLQGDGGGGGGGLGDPGSNGIVKRTSLNTTTAATAGTDFVAPGTATTFTAKQTFTPTASVAGAAVVCAALPSTPVNGDIVCDSGDSNKVKVRSNGAWITIAVGGGTFSAGNGIDATALAGGEIAVSSSVLQGTTYTLTVDIGSMSNGACWTSGDLTANGVGILDAVTQPIPYNGFNAGITLNWRIEGANNLRLQACNNSGGTVDPASGNFKAAVLKAF